MPYNLPSYEQQQSIKQDTQEILSQFPINGGTDFSNFKLVNLSFQSTQVLNPLTTVLSVQGKGFIDYLRVINIGSSSGSGAVQIFIDGELMIDVTNAHTGTSFSWSRGELILDSSAVNDPNTNNLPLVTTISNSDANVTRTSKMTLSDKLWFSESLEIKLFNVIYSANQYATVNVIGGVEK